MLQPSAAAHLRQSATARIAAGARRRRLHLFPLLIAVSLLCVASRQADADTPIGILVSGTAHEALFAIAFSGHEGIAVGSGGSILESADAGATWKTKSRTPTTLALLGVDLNATNAIAVGQSGLVVTRPEGHGEWVVRNSGTRNRLFSVALNATGEAVAVGAFGTILRSTDAGASWHSIAPVWKTYVDDGVEPHLYAANVTDSGVLTVCGEFGLILRSVNGGVHWDLVHKGDASIFALQIRPDGNGYAVGQSGTILQTSDRGSGWRVLAPPSKANLLGVESSADGRVVVTGMRDMLESDDDGRTWRHIITGETTTSWYGGIALPGDATAMLMVGHAGQIARVNR